MRSQDEIYKRDRSVAMIDTERWRLPGKSPPNLDMMHQQKHFTGEGDSIGN